MDYDCPSLLKWDGVEVSTVKPILIKKWQCLLALIKCLVYWTILKRLDVPSQTRRTLKFRGILRNVPHKLINLNTWYPLGGHYLGGNVEPVRWGASTKDVYHSGKSLRILWPCSVSCYSYLLQALNENDVCFCCLCFPCFWHIFSSHAGLYFSRTKLKHILSYSHCCQQGRFWP